MHIGGVHEASRDSLYQVCLGSRRRVAGRFSAVSAAGVLPGMRIRIFLPRNDCAGTDGGRPSRACVSAPGGALMRRCNATCEQFVSGVSQGVCWCIERFQRSLDEAPGMFSAIEDQAWKVERNAPCSVLLRRGDQLALEL